MPLPGPRLPPRALYAFALFAVSSAACVRADFVQSVPSFVVHEAAERPTVYFDHLPDRPYTSVGIIEIIAPAAAPLESIFDAAADKGKEIGCDLVVDRSIHRVAEEALPRWSVTSRARSTRSADARLLGFAPTPAAIVIAPAPPPPPPPVIYSNAYSPPPDRKEFICGVWAAAAPATAAPPALRGPESG